MRSDSHLIWLCVSCWFPWWRHSVFHIFGWSRWKNRMSQIPAAILWESYTWVSARWFSASPCCTISELCGVGSLSPRRLAQRSVHPGNLLTVARTIPWPVTHDVSQNCNYSLTWNITAAGKPGRTPLVKRWKTLMVLAGVFVKQINKGGEKSSIRWLCRKFALTQATGKPCRNSVRSMRNTLNCFLERQRMTRTS